MVCWEDGLHLQISFLEVQGSHVTPPPSDGHEDELEGLHCEFLVAHPLVEPFEVRNGSGVTPSPGGCEELGVYSLLLLHLHGFNGPYLEVVGDGFLCSLESCVLGGMRVLLLG